jgi:hypothetical protein
VLTKELKDKTSELEAVKTEGAKLKESLVTVEKANSELKAETDSRKILLDKASEELKRATEALTQVEKAKQSAPFDDLVLDVPVLFLSLFLSFSPSDFDYSLICLSLSITSCLNYYIR